MNDDKPPVTPVTPRKIGEVRLKADTTVNPGNVGNPENISCDRCGGEVYRMHAVWRCSKCGYKSDCCGW